MTVVILATVNVGRQWRPSRSTDSIQRRLFNTGKNIIIKYYPKCLLISTFVAFFFDMFLYCADCSFHRHSQTYQHFNPFSICPKDSISYSGKMVLFLAILTTMPFLWTSSYSLCWAKYGSRPGKVVSISLCAQFSDIVLFYIVTTLPPFYE